MSLKIPKEKPKPLTAEERRIAAKAFKPGTEHVLEHSNQKYTVDDKGAWRRQGVK